MTKFRRCVNVGAFINISDPIPTYTKDTSTQMYEAYWAEECEALLYDFPLSEEAIRQKGASLDPRKLWTVTVTVTVTLT